MGCRKKIGICWTSLKIVFENGFKKSFLIIFINKVLIMNLNTKNSFLKLFFTKLLCNLCIIQIF